VAIGSLSSLACHATTPTSDGYSTVGSGGEPGPAAYIFGRSGDDIVISSNLGGGAMTNILVRGLSDAAIDRIDSEALALGLSRNEYLRRKLEDGLAPDSDVALTADDWAKSASVFGDLDDPSVMDAAWR